MSKLTLPQARVLSTLLPHSTEDLPSEWPLLKRSEMASHASFTSISGTINRALTGIPEGSSSGPPQSGLKHLGLVEVIGVHHRITLKGVLTLVEFFIDRGYLDLPPVRDAITHTNRRYK